MTGLEAIVIAGFVFMAFAAVVVGSHLNARLDRQIELLDEILIAIQRSAGD